MNAEEQKQWLDDKGDEFANYLKVMGAVKHAHNEVPGVDFPVVTREELVEELGLTDQMFQPVKVVAISLGHEIAIFPGAGHYIGKSGESVTNIDWLMKMISGCASTINEHSMAMARAGILEDAKQFAKRYLGDCRLDQVPKRLKAIGVTMDANVEKAWLALSSGNNGND